MKPILAIGVAAVLGGSLPAGAQTEEAMAWARPGASTGPTVPDARQTDQATLPPAPTVAPTSANPASADAHWRTSDGFTADPNNPSDAPGGSSNPAR